MNASEEQLLIKLALEREKYFKRKLIKDRQTIQNVHLLDDDSDATFFLEKELTIVEQTQIEHFPTDTSFRKLWSVVNLGPGLKSIDYHELLRTGQSKYVAYGETEIPSATAKRKSNPNPVRKAKIKYSFEIEDLEYMARSGQSLEDEDAKAAKEGNEYTFNKTSFIGNRPIGLKGFFTYAQDGALAVVTPTTGGESGATQRWETKTADEIYEDCRKLKVAARQATRGKVDNNVLGVGINAYDILEGTYFFVNGVQTSETVLDRIKSKSMFERVEMCQELDNITVEGICTNVAVAIAFSDRTDVFKRHIPLELTSIPLQIHGFTHTVYMHADDAGLLMYRKYGGTYLLNVSVPSDVDPFADDVDNDE